MPGTRLCTRLSLDDFLSFNGPTGIIVAPDDSRANFLHHIGLSERTYRHRMLYRRMKREAVAGMERLFESRKSLEAEYVDDETIQPPFSVAHISECAFRRQVTKIYETASNKTRGIYDLTWTQDEGNWVIRWMLWRVLQRRQVRSSHTLSSSGETECSATSTCDSSVVDSVQTVTTSPFWAANPALTSHDPSDSEDWDDTVPVKAEKQHSLRPSLPAEKGGGFWAHVMDTT
ncbi:hypothetical protein AC579_9721 [Pseudocercospora musae]|uniref:Uncharacterized protein n=1 Tax=Pseudocercospora musae TaxID=113226 RepID=A0A139HZK6_9PEZI|nr:hypothetical protein AC579_9721 [Pseudocercospora musae]